MMNLCKFLMMKKNKKENCESDVTKEWDKSDKMDSVDKCENGKICTGDKCRQCECP